MVTWAHGTSGVYNECAPSNNRNIWHQFQLPYQLALNGCAVVATDNAELGLGRDGNDRPIVHGYPARPAHANGLFYSIAAARTAFSTLSNDNVVVGSSQGRVAAWAFAEKACFRAHDWTSRNRCFASGSTWSRPSFGHSHHHITSYTTCTSLRSSSISTRAKYLLQRECKIFDVFRILRGYTTLLFKLSSGMKIPKSGWHENETIQQYQKSAATGRKAFKGPLFVNQVAYWSRKRYRKDATLS